VAELSAKKGGDLLGLYGGSLINTLTQVFGNPFWSDIENQRHHLETIGKQHGILIAERWTTVHPDQIPNIIGTCLLSHYQNSAMKLFKAIYPNLTWSQEKKKAPTLGGWSTSHLELSNTQKAM
jgi:hypothetical protein